MIGIHVNQAELSTSLQSAPGVQLDSPVISAITRAGGAKGTHFLLPGYRRGVNAVAVEVASGGPVLESNDVAMPHGLSLSQ
jgi:hypothetical protein